MQKLRRSAGAAKLSVAVAALTMSSAATMAQDDFFSGKTVKIVVGFSPGGGYDTYARALARDIGKYIPGKPAVIVQNMPGAASLKSVLYLDMGAPQDGTVINTFNNGVILESMTNPDKVKIKFTDVRFIGSTTRDFRVCYAWHTQGIKSIKDVQGSRQFILGGTSKGATAYINGAIMGNLLGVNIKHVLGFQGSNEQRIAVERGETTGDCGSWSSIPDDWKRDKKIVPLVQFSTERSEDMPAGIPYAGDIVSDPKNKALVDFMLATNDLGKPYIVSKLVPADRLATLRKAFDDTMKDAEFLANAKKLNLPVTPVNGEESEKIVQKIYSATPEMVAAAIKAVE